MNTSIEAALRVMSMSLGSAMAMRDPKGVVFLYVLLSPRSGENSLNKWKFSSSGWCLRKWVAVFFINSSVVVNSTSVNNNIESN